METENLAGTVLVQKDSFNESLRQVEVPESVILCRNVHCRDKAHQNEIDKYVIEVLGCVEEKAFENLPVRCSTSCQQRKTKPGWSDLVRP